MANFSELQQSLLKAGWTNIEELKVVLSTLTDNTEPKVAQLKETLQSLIDSYFIYLGQLESLTPASNSVNNNESNSKFNQNKTKNITNYTATKIEEKANNMSLNSHIDNHQKQTTMNKNINLKENYNNQTNTAGLNVEFFKLDENNKCTPITPNYTAVDAALEQASIPVRNNDQIQTSPITDPITDPLIMQDWPEPTYDAEEDAGMQEAMTALKNGALSIGAEINTIPDTTAMNNLATQDKELNEAEQYMQSLLNGTVDNPNIDSDMTAWMAKQNS